MITVPYTVPEDVPASGTVVFTVEGYDATWTPYPAGTISVPGPLTAGSVVTAEGPTITLLAYCRVWSVTVHS